MPQSADPFSGIFICYRRDDSAGYAGRLYDHLAAHFGAEQIFIDVDQIKPGEDFVKAIEKALGSCAVLLALIGPNWFTRTDEAEQPGVISRYVRLEIAAALAHKVLVIPVLLHGAKMPRQEDLPEDLKPLADLNAFELSYLRWNHDVDQLIGSIEKALEQRREERQRAEQKEAERLRLEAEAQRRAGAPNRRPVLLSLIIIILLGAALFAFVYLRKPNVAARPEAAPAPFTNSVGIEFVWVPPGDFEMGSENGDSHEQPVHRVVFGEGFYISKYEVTQAQWQRVMGNNPSRFKSDDLPVDMVSLAEALGFATKLTRQNDGYLYHVPNEAEWEYAARAGTTGDYAGDLDAMAWYANNAGGQTHPVGSKKPNAFGLFDMHGNVAEWCDQWYHDTYDGAPTKGETTDGSLWQGMSEQKNMAVRGGHYLSDAASCRSAKRDWLPIQKQYPNVGFRVVAVRDVSAK